MKVCTFCGCKTDDKSRTCASCGSSAFMYVCPNCQNHFEGAYCPDCGTRFNAVAKTCPTCSTKYFSKACPNCGYIQSNSRSYRTGNNRPVTTSNLTPNMRIALAFSILGLFMLPIPFSVIALVMTRREKAAGNTSTTLTATAVISVIGIAVGCFQIMFMILSIIASAAK